MKKYLFLSACLTYATQAGAIPCPAITVVDYNNMPMHNPTLIVAGQTWGLLNNQGRANNIILMSAPETVNSIACSYDPNEECCNYTATYVPNFNDPTKTAHLDREFQHM